MKKLALLLATGLIFVPCFGERSESSEQMIDIGSHRLQVVRAGNGAPAVVIDSGLADQLEKLKALQEHIAQVTLVITYNRAGYGRSEPGPLPRDGGREAEELSKALEKAAVPGPYVLVGHSLGALNMQVFASTYPAKVAGMVLLDPPPVSFILGEEYVDLRVMAEQMTAEWESIADAGAESANEEDRARSAFFRMIASEHREMFGPTAKMVATISTFGDLPLVILAAGKPNPAFGQEAEDFQRYWIEQSRALAERSSAGKFILVEEASHHLYLDVPELVAESIISVVYEARRPQKGARQ